MNKKTWAVIIVTAILLLLIIPIILSYKSSSPSLYICSSTKGCIPTSTPGPGVYVSKEACEAQCLKGNKKYICDSTNKQCNEVNPPYPKNEIIYSSLSDCQSMCGNGNDICDNPLSFVGLKLSNDCQTNVTNPILCFQNETISGENPGNIYPNNMNLPLDANTINNLWSAYCNKGRKNGLKSQQQIPYLTTPNNPCDLDADPFCSHGIQYQPGGTSCCSNPIGIAPGSNSEPSVVCNQPENNCSPCLPVLSTEIVGNVKLANNQEYTLFTCSLPTSFPIVVLNNMYSCYDDQSKNTNCCFNTSPPRYNTIGCPTFKNSVNTCSLVYYYLSDNAASYSYVNMFNNPLTSPSVDVPFGQSLNVNAQLVVACGLGSSGDMYYTNTSASISFNDLSKIVQNNFSTIQIVWPLILNVSWSEDSWNSETVQCSSLNPTVNNYPIFTLIANLGSSTEKSIIIPTTNTPLKAIANNPTYSACVD